MRGWLAENRRKKGYTMLEMSKKLNITESYYSLIEAGERQKKLNLDLAAKLARIFEMPIEDIVALEKNAEVIH